MSDISKLIAKRLRGLRHAREWTIEETSRRLSAISGETIIPSRYGNWEQGIREPRREQIIALGRLFDVAPAYLAGFSDDDGTGASECRYIVPTAPTVSTPAGAVSIEQATDDFAISLELIERLGLSRQNLLMVRVDDDSMRGIIDAGDRVLIDLSIKQVCRDDIFAIFVNGRVVLRWIRHALTGGYSVQAEARDRYPDQAMSLEQLADVTILGRVAGILKTR